MIKMKKATSPYLTEAFRILRLQGFNAISLDFRSDSPDGIRMVSSGTGMLPDYVKGNDFHDGETPGSSSELLTGIFANEMMQNVVTRAYNFHLNAVHLAGSETAVYIENLRHTLVPDICKTLTVFKTICLTTPDSLQTSTAYDGIVDYLIFTFEGNSDPRHIAELLAAYQGRTPFLMTADTPADEAILQVLNTHSAFAGYDYGELPAKEAGFVK